MAKLPVHLLPIVNGDKGVSRTARPSGRQYPSASRRNAHPRPRPHNAEAPAGAAGDTAETLAYPSPAEAAVRELLRRGWSPIPLPRGQKQPPPTGVTGEHAPNATSKQIEAWLADSWFGNVAVRVADDVVGIDVDDYNDKGGAVTLLSAEAAYGPLPDGPRSGNRGVDNPSCQRWFRKPAGLKLHSPGGGVDLLQRHHRYAVVAPSLHPEGRRYEWYGTDGPDVPPTVDELPELPATWVTGLSGSAAAATAKGGRHDTMISRVYAKVGDGEEAKLPKLRAEFISTVGGDRLGGEGEAAAEFDRAVSSAREKRDAGLLRPRAAKAEKAAAEDARLLPESFWSDRQSLRGIRDHARFGLLCPDALFGAVLCRVLSHVGPNVTLPALVGRAPGSLNLIVASVGRSGAGKSTTQATAREIAWSCAGAAVELGSGEGIAAAYYGRVPDDRPDPDKPGKTKRVWLNKQVRFRLEFQASEVDGLAARMNRTGATLDATLRSLYSGEALGAAYADPDKRRLINPGSYRATVLVGVQPRRSAPLLTGDAADNGLAQRVLWLSAEDPRIQRPDPAAPEPTWKWESPLPPLEQLHLHVETDDVDGPPDTPGEKHEVGVPRTAREIVQTIRLAQVRGEAENLDGHGAFTQLKVATGLALLDGRIDMAEEDWQLAKLVMATSRAVRDHCRSELSSVTETQVRTRGRLEAVREAATENEHLKNAAAKLARYVWRQPEGAVCTGRQQKDAVGGSARRGLQLSELRDFAINKRWVAVEKFTPANPGAASSGARLGLVRGDEPPPETR